jgi:hypothetical protein
LPNYHSHVRYDDPQVGDIAAVNVAIARAAQANGLPVADAFAAFRAASGGDPCAAGLLVRTSSGCDVHPSPAGHQLYARTIQPLLAAR